MLVSIPASSLAVYNDFDIVLTFFFFTSADPSPAVALVFLGACGLFRTDPAGCTQNYARYFVLISAVPALFVLVCFGCVQIGVHFREGFGPRGPTIGCAAVQRLLSF